MQKLNVTIFLTLFITFGLFAQKADDIIGKYHLPNKLDIEIFKYKGKYFGKIIALNGFENGQKRDIKNSEYEKRNDLLIGKVIITSLEYDSAEKSWKNGKMYGAEKGMFFNLKIKEMKPNKITVEASKYFFRKSLDWEKL